MTTKITRSNIASTGVAAGSYSAADITVNSSGQVTSASASSIAASGGGGPKISGVVVTDSSWATLDDTAVDVLGGYIKITGSGFSSGCLVYINQTLATATTYISSTEVRAQLPATAAGTYALYLVNTDGGVGIRLPGVTFSASPSWQTSSTLSELYDGVAITLSLVAQEATSYTLVSGSLPPGLSLNSSTGAITGTIVGVTADTTYSFIVRATDAQLQDSPRTFTVNVAVSDPHFSKTTLLLSGSALSTNTVLRDSSTNNFNLTAFGDARASNFSPYGTGWSAYFDGTTDFVSTPTGQANLTLGTSDFTIEGWFYIGAQVQTDPALFTSDPGVGLANTIMMQFGASNLRLALFVNNVHLTASSTNNYVVPNQWNHIAVCRTEGSTYSYYINGVAVNNVASNSTSLTTNSWRVGYWTVGGNAFAGNISNFRIIKGTALYSGATITVPTEPLTAVANTQLLILQSNNFIDSSTNNFAITRNGDVGIRSFNPFGITNTGTTGSAYFDGTGDYLSVASNTALDLSGDFTVEGWFYFNSFSGDPAIFNIGSDGSGLVIRIVSSKIYAYFTGGGNVFGSSAPTLVTGAWYHFAWSRSGSSHKFFINGEQSGTTYSSSSTASSTGGLGIGRSVAGTSFGDFNGYISDVRVVKGTAVYTANFTSPTQPLTAVTNTQLLTLQYDQPHNNHTFLDSSSNQFLITRSGNATQGTFSPFSPAGYSYYLDGGDQFSSPSTANLNLNLYNNWTVEGWFYRKGTFGVNDNVLSLGTKRSAVWWSFYVGTSGGGAAVGFGTGSWAFATGPTGPSSGINLNQWHHVAFVRNGASTLLIFIDGILQYTNTSYNFGSATQGGTLYIGSYVNDADNVGAYYSGYISNLRIVNGQSLYTTNFTPSTSVLTTTSQGAIASNVALLTAQSNRFIDVSLSARAFTMSGDARVAAFTPFTPTAVYSPVTHGASAYFDGTTDAIVDTNLNNSQFVFAGDFTIEYWVYSTTHSGSNYSHVGYLGPLTSNLNVWGWTVSQYNSTDIGFFTYPGGSGNPDLIITGTVPGGYLGQWTYITIVRQGSATNNIKLYANGIQIAQGTKTGTIGTQNNNYFTIGGQNYSNYTGCLNGYITNVRITNGTALYTSSFTRPNQPLTSNANTNLLLNFTDAAIIDSTGRNVLETVADAKSSSVITKFTGGSMYFDGTGDWSIIPTSPNFGYGTGDFTIELWLYWTGSGTQTIVSNLTADASTNPHLYIGTNVLKYFTAGVDRITGSSITANQWYHIALSRASGSTKLFVNGTQSGSTYADSNNYGTTAPFGLATYWNNGTPNAASVYSGYISDLRITKGHARYTSNFTPPTGPHRLK